MHVCVYACVCVCVGVCVCVCVSVGGYGYLCVLHGCDFICSQTSPKIKDIMFHKTAAKQNTFGDCKKQALTWAWCSGTACMTMT